MVGDYNQYQHVPQLIPFLNSSHEDLKKVVSEPVKLDQEYRHFDFESPWEGTKYIKQEEEKNKNKDKL